MNKAIANILKEQLAAAGLTWIDKLAGMVQMTEYQETLYPDGSEAGVTTEHRIPISCDVELENCDKNDLVPDQSKKGILYFEDGGTTQSGRQGRYNAFISKLRLVHWFNTDWITSDQKCTHLAGLVQSKIITALRQIRLKNFSPFIAMTVAIDGVPKKDKTIFGSYTYNHFDTGYLLPPYEYFAIDLSITFLMMPGSCVPDISVKSLEQFNNIKNCTT